jgi:multiple sugar transport system permease protein
VVIAAVTGFPLIFAVVMSVSNVKVGGGGFDFSGLTLDNFEIVFKSEKWRYALAFTTFYTVVTVLAELVLGVLIALVVERLGASRGWMLGLLLIPWSLITVISATLWRYVYAAGYGVASWALTLVGFDDPVILGNSTSAIAALMVADVWKTTPFVAIIALAGLVSIPKELYEAAEVDGSSGWRTFWSITLPLIRSALLTAVLFRVLQAFGLFDLPFVLTGGGPGSSTTSLAMLGYNTMFTNLRFGPGAAIAVSTALIVTLGCLAFTRVFRAQVGSREG